MMCADDTPADLKQAMEDVLRPLNDPDLGVKFLEVREEDIAKATEAMAEFNKYNLQRIEVIKLRVQLAKENRLLTPLTYYAQDIEYLLNQLGYKVEEE